MKTRNLIFCAAALAAAVAAAGESKPAAAKSGGAAKPTTITAANLEFDYSDPKNYAALFRGSKVKGDKNQQVVVTDPQFTLKADEVLVHFENTNTVSRIDAGGNVSVTSLDRRATCGHARYTRTDGTIVMTKNPVVYKGEDSLRGGVITIVVGDSRVYVDEGVELSGTPKSLKDSSKK